MATTTRITSRENLEKRILARSMKDSRFRKALLAAPRETLERELSALTGTRVSLPTDIDVKVLEETATSFYLVLPSAPATSETEFPDAELSDIETPWELNRTSGNLSCADVGCTPQTAATTMRRCCDK